MQDGTFKGSCPRGWTRGSPTSTGMPKGSHSQSPAEEGGCEHRPFKRRDDRDRRDRVSRPPGGGIRKKDGSEAEAIVAERSNELLRRPACHEVLPLQVGIIRPDPVGGDRESRRHIGDVLGIDPDPPKAFAAASQWGRMASVGRKSMYNRSITSEAAASDRPVRRRSYGMWTSSSARRNSGARSSSTESVTMRRTVESRRKAAITMFASTTSRLGAASDSRP